MKVDENGLAAVCRKYSGNHFFDSTHGLVKFTDIIATYLAALPADDALNHVSAIRAMIGYCQSLEVGTVIRQEYMDRMNSYYIPNLEAIIRQHQSGEGSV